MDITVSNDRGNLGEGDDSDEAEGTGDPHRDVDQVEKGCCNRKTENTRVRSKQDTPSDEAQPNKGICHTLLNVFCCMCLLCCRRRYRWEETVLQDIGGRKIKKWYMCTLVRYWNGHTPKKLVHFQSASLQSTSDLQRTEELLFNVKAPTNCPLDLNNATLATLNGLLKKLRGMPGIEPVHVRMPFTEEVIGVYQPYHTNGSLKDLIYTSEGHTPNPIQAWGSKYTEQSMKPLKAEKIALYGRQILETLLYLYEKGFPPLGHVTSGNVFVEGEVCRLGGYENTLLGYKTRLYKLFEKYPEHIDVLMFGHLLFEMAAGYELTTTAPTEGDFNSITTTDPNGEIENEEIENEDVIVMVLAGIFAPLLPESKVKKFLRKLPLVPQRQFPSIKEVVGIKPFCDVELSSDWVIPKIDLSDEEEQLLGLVRGAIPFTAKAQGGPSAVV